MNSGHTYLSVAIPWTISACYSYCHNACCQFPEETGLSKTSVHFKYNSHLRDLLKKLGFEVKDCLCPAVRQPCWSFPTGQGLFPIASLVGGGGFFCFVLLLDLCVCVCALMLIASVEQNGGFHATVDRQQKGLRTHFVIALVNQLMRTFAANSMKNNYWVIFFELPFSE